MQTLVNEQVKICIIFVRDQKANTYIKRVVDDPEEKLTLLGMYFDSCVGYNSHNFEMIKMLSRDGIVGCNDVGASRINGRWQFQHDIWEDLQGPSLSTEELLALIKSWYELIDKQVDKIMITYEDAKYIIK